MANKKDGASDGSSAAVAGFFKSLTRSTRRNFGECVVKALAENPGDSYESNLQLALTYLLQYHCGLFEEAETVAEQILAGLHPEFTSAITTVHALVEAERVQQNKENDDDD
jgi:hypothetical protein